jgi:hypothetical protein
VVSRRAELLLALVAFLVLSILMTWPLVVDLGGQVPGDPVDPVFTSWIMAWGPQGFFRDPLRVFDAPMFHPQPLTLGLSENLLGLSLPLSPLWFVTRNAALMNNVAFLLSFTLNGFFAYLLMRKLGAPLLGSAVAGFAYAFTPYRFAQISHLHVEATFWTPVLFLVLARLAEGPSTRKAAALGVVGALQAWSSMNSGVVAAVGAAMVLPILLWAARRHLARFLAGLLLGGALALVLTAPLYLVFTKARSFHGVEPTLREASVYSADLQSFVSAPPSSVLLGDATAHFRAGSSERLLYPGVSLIALAAIGAWALRRSNPTLLAAAAIVFVSATAFAFGPRAGSITLPYRWMTEVAPFLLNLRVPTRIWPVAILALATPAAFALARRPALLSVFTLVLFLESLSIPITTAATPPIPSGYSYFEGRRGAILEIPAMRVQDFGIDPDYVRFGDFGIDPDYMRFETQALYRQTSHWLPIVNGLSATFPEGYLRLMQVVGEFPEPWTWDRLRRVGVRWVVIHPKEIVGTPWEGIDRDFGEMRVVYRSDEMIVVTVPALRAPGAPNS